MSLKKRKVLHMIDITGARACDALRRKALELERDFHRWRHEDPGLETRLRLVRELYELARACKPLGVDV